MKLKIHWSTVQSREATKRNNLKHQSLSTLVGHHDALWDNWLNSAVASGKRTQAENELLNNLDAPSEEFLDRWITNY